MSDRPKNNRPVRIPSSLLRAREKKWEPRLQFEAFFLYSPSRLTCDAQGKLHSHFYRVLISNLIHYSELQRLGGSHVATCQRHEGQSKVICQKRIMSNLGIWEAKLVFDNSCDILTLNNAKLQKKNIFHNLVCETIFQYLNSARLRVSCREQSQTNYTLTSAGVRVNYHFLPHTCSAKVIFPCSKIIDSFSLQKSESDFCFYEIKHYTEKLKV